MPHPIMVRCQNKSIPSKNDLLIQDCLWHSDVWTGPQDGLLLAVPHLEGPLLSPAHQEEYKMHRQ